MEKKNPVVLEIEPNVGAKPILFGMKSPDVQSALRMQPKWTDNISLEPRKFREEYAQLIGVDYDFDDRVYSVSLAPPPVANIELSFRGVKILGKGSDGNPLTVFAEADPNPYESYGFIIFDRIGIAATGYHDGDKSQRAITVYKIGTWLGLEAANRISPAQLFKR